MYVYLYVSSGFPENLLFFLSSKQQGGGGAKSPRLYLDVYMGKITNGSTIKGHTWVHKSNPWQVWSYCYARKCLVNPGSGKVLTLEEHVEKKDGGGEGTTRRVVLWEYKEEKAPYQEWEWDVSSSGGKVINPHTGMALALLVMLSVKRRRS